MHCAPKKSPMNVLQVSFQFSRATGDVEPSYQTAIWLEDEEGYVKTLLLSEYLSYGGYNDSTICPSWNSKADWGNAPMDAYDAVTRATPPLGDHLYLFDLDTLNVEPGEYWCCLQTHIIEDYNILFKNKIKTTEPSEEVQSDAVFIPSAYPGAEQVLTHVMARVVKKQ